MKRITRSKKDYTGAVPEITTLDDEGIIFSFRLLDLDHPKFSTTDCKKGYIGKFVERLHKLNHLSLDYFKTNRGKALRGHRINWLNTTERKGFRNLPDYMVEEEAWQFQISKSSHGRVHGLLVNNTFYIVWLDPLHKLYSK